MLAAAVATRKLASYEANAAATDDDETETNQYGEAFNDMDTLDDDEDEPTAGAEWASFDPELESRVAENYGVGEGWVEDDAFHTRLVLAFAGIAAAVTDVATLAKVVQADVPATVEADAAVLYIRDSTTEELWCFRCVRELSPPTLSHYCRRWVCVWRAPRLV